MTLGHQLVAMDKSARSEPNGIVVERKLTMVYRTEATASTGGRGKQEEKMKSGEKETTDNISATEELPSVAKAEEADQEQCGSDTNKKIRIEENNFLFHSIRIL